MNIEIRPVNSETDDIHIARIWSAIQERLITVTMVRESYQGPFAPDYQLYRAVGLNAAQEIVGYIVVEHESNDRPDRFALRIMVDPAHRHQGIGRQLYEHARQQAENMGATCFTSSAL